MAEDEKAQTSLLRALAHPVRLRILSLLTGTELSAAEIARELDLTHANTSYHLRVLASAGEVEVAGEEKIRGGVAKRYRHPWNRPRGVPELPTTPTDEDRRLYVRAVADELVRRFDQREHETRSLLTDAEMWVPPEVWEQVIGHLEEASDLVHAEARPPRTEGTVHVNLTGLAFGMQDPPGPGT